MVRFIASLLIVSLLTLNVAWAVDECAFTDPGEPSGVSHLVDCQVPADPSSAGPDCDDWCPAWVSSIALPGGSIVPDSFTPATLQGGFYVPSYSSLALQPPFHPPIA